MNDDRDDILDPAVARAAEVLKAPPPVSLPPGFAAAVVRQAARPAGGPLDWLGERVAGWFRPRRVSPAVLWGWSVGLCLLTAVATWRLAPPATPEASQTVLVRFAVRAPAARSVALAGDFNDWDRQSVRLQRGADDQWHALVPLEPGVYQYMFVVDGERWIADPSATERLDDGFGQQNSVVRILDATSRERPRDGFL